MAKKKVVTPEEEDEEDLDDLADDLFDDEETVEEYPKVSEKKKEEGISSAAEDEDLELISEDEEFELEEEARFPDYKYLKLKLSKKMGEDDYELIIEGQSHGFCNILVKHLLNIEGVNSAAYKVTGIVPAQIFIRLEDRETYKIKDILFKAIEALREEVLETQKIFKKLS